jgi:hypothetical protein
MITLSNINSYEPLAKPLSQSVLEFYQGRKFRLNSTPSSCKLGDNWQVMGLEFKSQEVITSGLGPEFDERYPTFEERLYFFMALSALCGIDCRPRQAELGLAKAVALSNMLTAALSYLQDTPLSKIVRCVHYTHESLGCCKDHKPLEDIMSGCPLNAPIIHTQPLTRAHYADLRLNLNEFMRENSYLHNFIRGPHDHPE